MHNIKIRNWSFVMSVNIGDRVRFLNDIGGGVVVGFDSDKRAMVECEDGFCIPCAVNECVVIPSEKGSNVATTTEQERVGEQIKQSATICQAKTFKSKDICTHTNSDPNALRVYLLFLPLDIDHIESSTIRVLLVNDSPYSLFFNYMSSEDRVEYKRRKSAQILPNERFVIEDVLHANISRLENIHMQIIAFKLAESFKPLQPIDRSIVVKPIKLCKQTSFIHSNLVNHRALTIDLSHPKEEEVKQKELDLKELKQAISQKRESNHSVSTPAKRSSVNQSLIEVDLHIDKLIDSTVGMNNGDILEYQLSVFRRSIEENMLNRGVKIVFIHGKGDGVLRSSIIRELGRLGLGKRHQPASFKKYGYGATMVTI